MQIRLQKVISNAGIASRRKAEEMIRKGRVQLNGKTHTTMGTLIDPEIDSVEVDHQKIEIKPIKTMVYAFYKPKSCVTTLNDPEGRKTIVSYFPKTHPRLFPIGRLDYDTEGLLLLTNDGNIAQKIAHPSKHIWKTYFVKIKGHLNEKDRLLLEKGPIIDGKKRQSLKIKVLHKINHNMWLEVVLQEGINRQIKKMFSQLKYRVLKIKRFQIGNISLEDMKPGEMKLLSQNHIQKLMNL